MGMPYVRPTETGDIDALLNLQLEVYPSIPAWTRGQLAHQLEVFPEGQLVAVHDGAIVGCASSLVILWDEWTEEHTWHDVTSSGTFHTHNPNGFTLYGAEVFVAPQMRGLHIGHKLYEGRREICRNLNLRRIIACGRLPGYRAYSDKMSVGLYAKKVLWGDLSDPVLSFQLHEGFRYCGIVEGYLPEDADSCGNASLIAWLNPHYNPDEPTVLQRRIGNPNHEQQ